MKKNKQKVCVAMSGGVDSSAAAYLLKEQGYDVFGITMDLLEAPYCTDNSSIQDAKKVADKLGIEHHYLDLRKEFRKQVVEYFTQSYLQGLTPSPCIMCNKEIKLGLLAQKAFELGADVLVTGHYAELIETPHGIELHRAEDLQKDQSYFLFAIDKETLQKIRCPLAKMTKDETRAIAKKAGLEVHKKADSQDICFVQNGKYAELIETLRPNSSHEGNIIDNNGNILGKHKGIIHYTVGQRRGLGISAEEALFVIKIDAKNNNVIVGKKEELLENKLFINNINWLGEEKPQEIELMVKLRSRQNLVAAKVKFLENDTAEVTLLEDFSGIAPGQGCCFYQGSRVLGGGFII